MTTGIWYIYIQGLSRSSGPTKEEMLVLFYCQGAYHRATSQVTLVFLWLKLERLTDSPN